MMDGRVRKRKAETLDINNERLSKKLRNLNLDHNGDRIRASVEQRPSTYPALKTPERRPMDDDTMQLDDTKHKVYIYNLDKELEDIESSEDDNKVVFLPDIEKHLLETRIPPAVLANENGELAGVNKSQAMVLYDIPHSLTLTDEKDSVRRAIIDARKRAQEMQKNGQTDTHKHLSEILATQSIPQPSLSGPITNSKTDVEPAVRPIAELLVTEVMDLD